MRTVRHSTRVSAVGQQAAAPRRQTRVEVPRALGTFLCAVVLGQAPLLSGCHFQASFSTAASAQRNPGTTNSDAEATPASTGTTPAQASPSKPAVTLVGNRLALPGAIHFQPNSPLLLPASGTEEVLAQLKAYLDQTPRVSRIRVEGHLDNSRDEAVGVQLSGYRAATVRQWLLGQGIAPERAVAVGFGSSKPVASNATPEGRVQNERIDVRVIEVDGKPFLGQDTLGGGQQF